MSEKTEATVKLDSPIKRGDTTITEIMLRKPQSGALRGTRLQAVMEMDVASMMTVIPHLHANADPAGNGGPRPGRPAAMSVEVVLFCCRSRHLPICRQPDGR